MKKKVEITKKSVMIEIALLERIADYYEFPMAVFFMPARYLKGTRKGDLYKRWNKRFRKIEKLIAKIKEILDE